jgi:hypothetical protein
LEVTPAESALDQASYASRVFLDSVRRIPDVLRVVRYDEELPDLEPAFLVVVPTLYGPAAEGVFALEAEIHRNYPNVRLEARVKGLKERGLTVDEADLLF